MAAVAASRSASSTSFCRAGLDALGVRRRPPIAATRTRRRRPAARPAMPSIQGPSPLPNARQRVREKDPPVRVRSAGWCASVRDRARAGRSGPSAHLVAGVGSGSRLAHRSFVRTSVFGSVPLVDTMLRPAPRARQGSNGLVGLSRSHIERAPRRAPGDLGRVAAPHQQGREPPRTPWRARPQPDGPPGPCELEGPVLLVAG